MTKKSAIYDNPNTSCREAWVDGHIIAHISRELMYTKGFDGHRYLPFYLNVDINFVPGRIIGDREAIGEQSGHD